MTRTQTPVDITIDLITDGTRTPLATTAIDWAARAIAVQSCVITWGSPTGLAPLTAGTAILTLRSQTPNPIAWDDELLITAGGGAVFHGWVESYTYQATGATWETRVELTDAIGRAGAAKLAAEPWPQTTVRSRITQILAAAPVPMWSTPIPNPIVGATDPWVPQDWGTAALDTVTGQVRARDVDNADLLDALLATLAWSPWRLVDDIDGLTVALPPGTVISSWRAPGGPAWAPPTIVTIPAATIRDTARAVTRDSIKTEIVISHYQPDPTGGADPIEARTTITGPGHTRYASSTATIQTDGYGPATWPARLAASITRQNATPRPTITTAILHTADLPLADVLTLAGLPTRHAALIRIPGHPADLDYWHRPTGGTITLTGGHASGALALTLRLEPADMSGSRPLRISDIPGQPDGPRFRDIATSTNRAVALRIRDLPTTRLSALPRQRFTRITLPATLDPLRIRDLAAVAIPTQTI